MAAPKKGTPGYYQKLERERETMLIKYGSPWAVHQFYSKAGSKGGKTSHYSHFQDNPEKASMAGQVSSRSFNKLPLHDRRADYYVKELLKEEKENGSRNCGTGSSA